MLIIILTLNVVLLLLDPLHDTHHSMYINLFNIFKDLGTDIHPRHLTDTLLVVLLQVVIHLRPILQEAQLVRDPVGHHNTQVTQVDHHHKGVQHHRPRRQLRMTCTVGLAGHSNPEAMVLVRPIQEARVVHQHLLLGLQIQLNLPIKINIRYVFRLEVFHISFFLRLNLSKFSGCCVLFVFVS